MLNEKSKQLKEYLDPHIQAIGSENEVDYFNEYSVTLFLNNGYRIISIKSFFVNQISVEMFAPIDGVKSQGNIYLEEYNAKRKLYEVSEEGIRTNLTPEAFALKLESIAGMEVINFLRERHEYFQYLVVMNPASSVSDEQKLSFSHR